MKICPKQKGFTLIELMIVVVIIAILAVVAVAVFGNQQRNARDARRRADISAIASALEAGKVATSINYPVMAATLFSSGAVPADPIATNTTPPDNACPGVCKYCVRGGAAACASGDATVAPGAPAAGATWTVCANLEAGGFFCRSNSQ